LDSPSEMAPHTAQRILEAARDILGSCGIRKMTLAAVAREAHVDVKTVAYHFGDRRGLLEALCDFLYHDLFAEFAQVAVGISSPEARWAELLRTLRKYTGDPLVSRAYYSILTESLFDVRLRERISRLMAWGMQESMAYVYGESARNLKALNQVPALDLLLLAAIDGIELHRGLWSDEYPAKDVLDLLERLAIQERRRQLEGADQGDA
jgi:AcrR family transcriptional regulator